METKKGQDVSAKTVNVGAKKVKWELKEKEKGGKIRPY